MDALMKEAMEKVQAVTDNNFVVQGGENSLHDSFSILSDDSSIFTTGDETLRDANGTASPSFNSASSPVGHASEADNSLPHSLGEFKVASSDNNGKDLFGCCTFSKKLKTQTLSKGTHVCRKLISS